MFVSKLDFPVGQHRPFSQPTPMYQPLQKEKNSHMPRARSLLVKPFLAIPECDGYSQGKPCLIPRGKELGTESEGGLPNTKKSKKKIPQKL